MSEPIFYESHSHTPLCKHAVGLPTEYAAAAHERGLRGLTVTCHNPMPDGFSAGVRMAPEQFDEYLALVEQTRIEWEGRVEVRLGLEADYFPGYEGWLERQLDSAPFHYVLGSIHPQIAEFRDRHWQDDPIAFQRVYFDQLAVAAETGLFDCLAHPDLVKNQTPEDWNPSDIWDDILAALDRIARAGAAMELNTSGLQKAISEMNPFPEMLREMCVREIPVVIGSDAHRPGRVGADFETALDLLTACGYDSVSYFTRRQRHTLPIAAVRESLRTPASLR